jgi:hypothetical protein
VEVRAQAIGTNTGGVFQCDFTNGFGVLTNGAGISNSTGPLTITSTNWMNVTNVVYLTNGTYGMKLHCLTNAPYGTNVGRFNYISVYPYLPPPTNGSGSTNISSSLLNTNTNYISASNNAVVIQGAVNSLGSAGGIVQLPSGTYMVAQSNPNELTDAYSNAAVAILGNNVELAGAGSTNTYLVAYNRATTIFSLGKNQQGISAQCSNFTLCNMTIEGQPHEAVTNVTNVVYVPGPLFPSTNGPNAGALTILYGLNTSQFSYNILVTNCQFSNYDRAIVMNPPVSNVTVQACNFVPTGGIDTWGKTNVYTGQTNLVIETGIYGQPSQVYNVVVVNNTFNGNCSIPLTNTNTTVPVTGQDFVNTNNGWFGPDGFAWFQSAGNVFLARNFITNNALEAFQMDQGPTTVVGNTFYTRINDGSCCALNGATGDFPNTDPNLDTSITFVGNSVYGQRHGALVLVSTTNGVSPANITVSGNLLNLSPPLTVTNDYPGAAVTIQICQQANVVGNTLVAGGHGLLFGTACSDALILNNNFAGAAYRGIGSYYIGCSLTNAQIFGNVLSEGSTFHVQLFNASSFGWFMGGNTNLDVNSNSVPTFLDPASSAVHIFN